MRYAALLFVLGCAGSKQASGPTAMEPVPAGEEAAAVEASREPPPPPDTGGYRLVAPGALAWVPVEAGKPGPELAVVTGDPGKGGGFFLRLPAGAKSGMHVHTADYHAIVISGSPKHWLPGEDRKAQVLEPGSYWFQPGKQAHADECVGPEPCVLYLVVAGGFDMTPAPDAKPGKPGGYFAVARRDVKLEPVDDQRADWIKIGNVSGDPKTGPVAFIVELPPGASSGLHSHTSEYHALVIGGAPAHWLPHEVGEGEPLATGTYWYQPGGRDHGDRCTGTTACHIFVMMPKAFDGKPAKPKQ